MDSRDKRSSAVMVGLPFRAQFPTPDSSLATEMDWLHIAFLYRGVLSSPVSGAYSIQYPRTVNTIRYLRTSNTIKVR